MSIFGGGTKTTTTTHALDPATQQYLDAYRQKATATAGAGPSPYYGEAADIYRKFGDAAPYATNFGLGDIASYFNPYQQEVVGGVQSDFDRQRKMALAAAGDQATRAGAFGGSRSAVLAGTALRGVNENEANTLSQLRYSGFQSAVDQLLAERARAGQLGLSGAQGLFGVGQGMTQDELARLSPMLAGASLGGYTDTQVQKTPGIGLFRGLLGAGLLAAAPFTGGATLGAGVGVLSGGGDSFGGTNPFGGGSPGGYQVAPTTPVNWPKFGGGSIPGIYGRN